MISAIQPPKKAALTFIFVTVLIDMLAFGMIIPVLPVLVQDFMGGNAASAAAMYGLFRSQGCADLYLRHRAHRYAGLRHDHSRAAGLGSGLHGRQRRKRGGNVRPVPISRLR